MKKTCTHFFLCIIIASAIVFTGNSGCANIIPPTGGPRDSLPPVLIAATPKDSTTRFTGNRIVLNFDEYVELQNAFENVIVSPTPNNVPIISYHFRTVSVRIKDTLEPNTTYSINFGNAIKDVNEGNVYKDFTYVFSTGTTLDQNTLSGKVVMAQTGDVDSTLIVVLHRNLDDSAVAKEKPRYITKLDGKGNFMFHNLAPGTFALYAIPNDYSKHYDDSTKPFAFADSAVSSTQNSPVTLYAYQLPKADTVKTKTSPAPAKESKSESKDKLLRFQSNLDGGRQGLLDTLTFIFNRPVTKYDTAKMTLTSEDYKTLTNYRIVADTTGTHFSVLYNWPPDTRYNLLFDKNAFADSGGVTLTKTDTIAFSTKRNEDYGSLKLRFNKIDYARNPVVQIVQNENIVVSGAIIQREWYRKLFEPGDYEIRILYDTNKNGKWDPGKFFGTHVQPEIVISLDTKLTIRGNWDNEKDITL